MKERVTGSFSLSHLVNFIRIQIRSLHPGNLLWLTTYRQQGETPGNHQRWDFLYKLHQNHTAALMNICIFCLALTSKVNNYQDSRHKETASPSPHLGEVSSDIPNMASYVIGRCAVCEGIGSKEVLNLT